MQTVLTGVIPLRGDLRIAVRDANTNEVRWRYEIRNTITYVALKSLVNLIAQKSTTNPLHYKVAYLRMGTSAVAPTRADTDLLAPALVVGVPFSIALGNDEKYLTITNPFEMKIVATLGAGDLNGLALTEAGLFTHGTTTVAPPGEYPAASGFYPELFARQIHPAINKTGGFVIDYDWRISFTA